MRTAPRDGPARLGLPDVARAGRRGVKLSTSAVGLALVAQVAVMLAVCIAVLIRGPLSAAPFPWAHLDGG